MKKHQTYVILFFALLFSMPMSAKVDNYVGAYAQVGEWTLLPIEGAYGASFGAAGGVGFLYELQAGNMYSPTRFLFDVGAGFHGGLTSFMQGSDQNLPLLNQTDLSGETFDYIYELQDRRDRYTNLAVQVPLMLGVHHRKFYMLAGVKMYANVFTKTHSAANLTTYGRYAAFGEFRDMPEYQFFNDLKKDGGVKTQLNLDLDLSLEIGGRLGVVTDAVGYDVPKRKIEYRLAGFFDFGLMDIHVQANKDPLESPAGYDTNPESKSYVYKTTSMLDGLVMNDIMSTSGFAKAVHSMQIGLKFTVLFQLPEEGKCVICKDAYRSSFKGGNSSSARMKYEE